MLEKSRNAVFFHRFVCRVSPKVGLFKAAGCGGRCWEVTSKIARRCGEKHICKSKCAKHVSNLETYFEVPMSRKIARRCGEKHILKWKMLKNWRSGTTFGSSDAEKIVRRCGEKHILKWKCTKHVSSEAFFEVTMSQNCTPLWRKAHFKVKMLKNCSPRTTFGSSDAQKLYAAVAKSTFESQNVKKTGSPRSIFWRSTVEKFAWHCGEMHMCKWKWSKNCRLRSTFGRSDDNSTQGRDVVYVIECLSVHSVKASRMSSNLSGENGWTGWSTQTVWR